MPITSPSRLKSGPPELPGLMAASVWMMSPAVKTPPPVVECRESRVRPSAETMPVVMVLLSPKGLPMAITVCPTCRASESPRGSGCSSPAGAFTLTTAMSESRSVPTTVPYALNPLVKSTSTCVEPSTTW